MSTVYYAGASELATLTNEFRVDGVATDPTTVSLIVTAPDGTETAYAYAAGQLTRTAAGAYRKDVPVPSPGLWSYRWIGTGAAADVAAGSWRVEAPDTRKLYTSLELLKDSLDITDNKRDAILSSKLESAARSVDRHCGRRFWLDSVPVARTYPLIRRVVRDSDGSERLIVGDIGVEAGVLVEIGTAGGGVWVPLTDYELVREDDLVEESPWTSIRRYSVPWSASRGRTTRVRVTARWGFPAVPQVVAEATLLQATRLHKRKSSPEGVAGTADWGAVRVTRVDPDVEALLRDFVILGVG